jgi:hypothetical protein
LADLAGKAFLSSTAASSEPAGPTARESRSSRTSLGPNSRDWTCHRRRLGATRSIALSRVERRRVLWAFAEALVSLDFWLNCGARVTGALGEFAP